MNTSDNLYVEERVYRDRQEVSPSWKFGPLSATSWIPSCERICNTVLHLLLSKTQD